MNPTPERPVIGVEAVLALADATAATLTPVAGDPDLPALDKLLHFFSALARVECEAAGPAGVLVAVWCSDDNAVLRQKLRPGIADRIAPLLADIIGQGVQEGVFTVAYPDQMGRVIVALIQDLNDRPAELVLTAESGPRTLRTVEHTMLMIVLIAFCLRGLVKFAVWFWLDATATTSSQVATATVQMPSGGVAWPCQNVQA